MGTCQGAGDHCEGDSFLPGPMAVIVDQIVEGRHGYSPLELLCCGFVIKRALSERAQELKAVKKSIRLPGPKREKETGYFFNRARAFARIAQSQAQDRGDTVVAVLFQDADCEANAGRGEAAAKRQSMEDGFTQEEFDTGVPMVPEPTSEAWLVEGFRNSPNANAVEDTFSGLTRADKLKKELEVMLGEPPTRARLRSLVESNDVNIENIETQSFIEFKTRLEEVI